MADGHSQAGAALEARLREGLRGGTWVDFGTGDAAADDPRNADDWGQERQIDSELIVRLITEATPGSTGARSLRIRGARIVGNLDLEFRTLLYPLMFQSCRLEQVNLEQAVAVAVWFDTCAIDSVSADQLRAQFNVGYPRSWCANGIDMKGAQIGGQLSFKSAHLANRAGPVLIADSMVVGDGMYCDGEFVADGEVRLVGAHIKSQLTLAGARLTNKTGAALTADLLVVDSEAFCNEDFSAEGEVRLVGARFLGGLDLTGARLSSSAGASLVADSIFVAQSAILENLTARGGLRLVGSHIGRDLVLSGATLGRSEAMDAGPDADPEVVLDADGMVVDRTMTCTGDFTVDGQITVCDAELNRLTWQPTTAPAGSAKFAGTKVGFLDDVAESWPVGSHLDKLTYSSLRGLSDHGSVTARLGWLQRAELNEGYRPRAYNELARVYREAGYDDAARSVLIEKQRARARSLSARHKIAHENAKSRVIDGARRMTRVAADWFLTYTIGYGHRPGRILFWLVGALGLATVVFALLHPRYVVTAADAPPGKDFNAFLYSLDLLLPVATLGQRGRFVTYGPAEWVSAVLIVTGWLLGAVLIAGISGVFKRD